MTLKVLQLQLEVDMGVMAMKVYSIVSKSSELDPHYQMQFSILPRTFLFEEDIVSIL